MIFVDVLRKWFAAAGSMRQGPSRSPTLPRRSCGSYPAEGRDAFSTEEATQPGMVENDTGREGNADADADDVDVDVDDTADADASAGAGALAADVHAG